MVSYMIICGDFLIPVFRHWLENDSLLLNRTFVIGIIAGLFLLPLSLIPKITSLTWTSLIGIVFSFAFVIIVIVRCFVPSFNKEDIVWANFSLNIFQSIGTVVFAYSCHTNLLPISSEMQSHCDTTQRDLVTSIHLSSFVCFLTYATTGIFGYLTFYAETQGNIMNNYPPTDSLIDVMRICLTV